MKAPVSLTSFRPQKSLAIAIGVLAVVVLPFLSYYTVNEGERGILLRYGKIVKVAEPGLGFKIPFMESGLQPRPTTGTNDSISQLPH